MGHRGGSCMCTLWGRNAGSVLHQTPRTRVSVGSFSLVGAGMRAPYSRLRACMSSCARLYLCCDCVYTSGVPLCMYTHTRACPEPKRARYGRFGSLKLVLGVPASETCFLGLPGLSGGSPVMVPPLRSQKRIEMVVLAVSSLSTMCRPPKPALWASRLIEVVHRGGS